MTVFVVTGGSGFIGSALCRELFKRNTDFKVIDVVPPRNFAGNFKKADIRTVNCLDSILSKGDTVVHLAALTNAHESDEKMNDYFKTNVIGTYNVVKACVDIGCKLVFASSMAVYDPKLNGPINEACKKAPVNFYGVTKLLSENLIQHAQIPHVILRFTNVYGPGGKGVINIFAKKASMGFPIEVWAGGNQSRDFIHINDVVNAILLSKKKSSGTYNISSGENTKILDLAKLIIKLGGSRAKIIFKEKKEDEIRYQVPFLKARGELGFKPTVSLKEGIQGLL